MISSTDVCGGVNVLCSKKRGKYLSGNFLVIIITLYGNNNEQIRQK